MFDAEGMILGRLASATADLLLKAAREDRDDKVIIVNAEKAIVSGSKTSVFNNYQEKYKLNHARKGPFFPRIPDMILACSSWNATLPKQEQRTQSTAKSTC